jgi:hypothetical protein
MRLAWCVLLLGLVAGPRVPAFPDVQDAVARAYGDAVTAETGRPPSFIVGDFNWDGADDLAVIVRPVVSRLPAINSDVANWVLEDPMKVRLLDFLPRRASLPPPTRVAVQADEPLLAVIHGLGPDGWRSRQISHFYLLHNAGASALRRWSRAGFYAATSKAARKLHTVRGDVIGETRGRTQGFLVYAGGKYAWYAPD